MNITINGALDDDLFAYITVAIFNTGTYEVCKNIKAIIDTGAQDCLVKRELVAKLGLQPIDTFKALNPEGGIITSDLYKVGLITDTNNYLDTSKYVTIKMGILEEDAFPADIILGGTFLRHCRFTFNGLARRFEIHVVL